MSTPTPRTDATWSMSFYPPEFSAAHTARTMRDECAKLERELAAERKKVRVLKLDKDRLDWWSGEPYYQFGKSHKCMNPGWWWSCGFESGMHSKYGIKNIRDAIDSAMAYSKSGRNKYNVCKRIEQSSTEDDK